MSESVPKALTVQRSKPNKESSSEDDEESQKDPEPVIVLLDENTIKNCTFEKLEYYRNLPDYSPHRSVPEALTVQSRPMLLDETNYRTKVII
uniref:Uncharacterized protein n=1 Tax=Panagrolaimus superbus TaxID=310955 RepID=A0A914YX40_9BILA